MKTLIVLILLGLGSFINAQVVVTVKPNRPKVLVVKPAKTKRGYVWIPGHWRYDKPAKEYRWVKGRWKKKRRGHTWVEGHWKKTPRGHQWVPGHWRRV